MIKGQYQQQETSSVLQNTYWYQDKCTHDYEISVERDVGRDNEWLIKFAWPCIVVGKV